VTTIEVPNLLGDSIYASFFIRRYIETHPEEQIEILLPVATWCMDIYKGILGVCNVRVKADGERPDICVDLSRAFGLCVGTYGGIKPFWHGISETLGLNTEDMLVPPITVTGHCPYSLRQRVLLSPYSASCGSRSGGTPNKMLPMAHWQLVFDLVHDMWVAGWVGKPLFIGGPGEQILPDVLPEYELLGAALPTVVGVVKTAQCIIGVDTGTVRLANMLKTTAFYTTPLGLGKMFMPEWGGDIAHETGDPLTLSPTSFRNSVSMFLKARFC
jgi:hypothetical protein